MKDGGGGVRKAGKREEGSGIPKAVGNGRNKRAGTEKIAGYWKRELPRPPPPLHKVDSVGSEGFTDSRSMRNMRLCSHGLALKRQYRNLFFNLTHHVWLSFYKHFI